MRRGDHRQPEAHRGGGTGKKLTRGEKIPLNTAWLLYWGRRLGMSRREILATPVGEMLDMMDCNAIAHGAKVKPAERSLGDILFHVR